jgi:hypothetical protein
MRAIQQPVAECAARVGGVQDTQRRFAGIGRQRRQRSFVIAGPTPGLAAFAPGLAALRIGGAIARSGTPVAARRPARISAASAILVERARAVDRIGLAAAARAIVELTSTTTARGTRASGRA